MANISINGAHYTDVPRIDVPKTSGGGNASFYETSGDTATAADIAYGKTAHGASGLITGEAVAPTPVLQDKTVKSTGSSQTVTADSGYDGLGTITVSPISLQVLFAFPSQSDQTITPDSGMDGIGRIYVKRAVLQDKTISPSTSQQVITADTGNYGLGQVTVNAMNLQTKQVTPTSSQQVITADRGYDGLEEVIVDASSGGSSAVLQPTKSATAQEASVTVTPDTGYDAMEQVIVAPDNMALMASKSASDVSGPGSAVLLDMENSFAGSFFYGFNAYFRNNVEDSDVVTSDFAAPKYWKIKLPKTMTELGGRAFMGVAGLCEVDANPDNGVKINARAFYACKNLQTLGGLWAKITTINGNGIRPLRQGDGSGSLLERNKDISAPMLTTVPSGSDGAYALSRCAFKSFTAPLLQRVGNNMFAYCYYLQTLDFTAVTTIEAQAFRGCTSLTDIYLRNTSGVVTLQNTNAFSTPYQVTVHVPSSLVSDYLNDTNWSASGVTITSI